MKRTRRFRGSCHGDAGRAAGVFLGALVFLAAAAGAGADVRSLVNTGHVGAVLDLQYDEKRDLLFSAGEEGAVKIWDAKSGSLVRSLRVTPHAAQMIAVNPRDPQVAVVAVDGLRAFSVSVWDWEQEKQIIRIPLKEAPLFVRFSGQGTWLVYGVSAWQGLKIVDVSTGDALTFHPEGFGIVGFAEVSRSEKTIMTYQITGRISYWDLASGDLVREVPTAPYLSRIRISRDRRFLVGNTGREALLIDTFTGAVRGRASINGDVALDISPGGDRLAGVPAAGGIISRWVISGDTLAPQPAPLGVEAASAGASSDGASSMDSFQALCYGSDELFIAAVDGRISATSESGGTRRIGQNALAGITGVDAARGLLALGGPDWVRVFSTDLRASDSAPTYVRSILFENPWKAPVGLMFLSDSTLLAWTRDDKLPRFAVLDLPVPFPSRLAAAEAGSRAHFRVLTPGFRAPLVDLAAVGTDLLGIETGGTVRVVDMASGATRFERRVPAVSAIVRSSPAELVGGRNTALAAGGSLVRINTRTGETVGIAGRNVFSWDLVFDSAGLSTTGPALYAVGVDAAGATNLLRYDGPGFERETVLASDPEEDLDASLALDPDTHAVFASVGRARVVSWDGRETRALPAEVATSRKLLARDGLLMSLNRDSTLTISAQATGERIAELSLFPDGEWAVLAHGGGYLASPGGDARVSVFLDDEPVSAREDYRLRIEQW
ncbi:MAG TPA: hypothetical protein VMV03_01260 [Spirochaetia bacterium]|nr:hypothetical protein [Spirochaetia bacterium]